MDIGLRTCKLGESHFQDYLILICLMAGAIGPTVLCVFSTMERDLLVVNESLLLMKLFVRFACSKAQILGLMLVKQADPCTRGAESISMMLRTGEAAATSSNIGPLHTLTCFASLNSNSRYL